MKTLDDISSMNEFMVGVQGDHILIMRPPTTPLTRERALNLAAWLVTLADQDDEFGLYLEKIEST